jgi:transposase
MPRHRLRDAIWASLHAKLVAIPGIWKRDPEPLRRFIEAVVYILRTGVAWEDLPERFGKPNSVYRRFRRWSQQGIWDELFLDGVPTDALETVMLDATACKAQRYASGARGGGEEAGCYASIDRRSWILSLPPKRANSAMEASTMRSALETTIERRRKRASQCRWRA